MKKLIVFIIALGSFASTAYADKDKNIEFSLDSGEAIQVEDSSEMESIDSKNFDKAFEDPKKKKRSRKKIVKKNQRKKKVKVVKKKKVQPNVTNKAKVKSKAVDKKPATKVDKKTKKESYFDRVIRVVKSEYGKAKVKAKDLYKKLKKEWDLSK